MTRRSPVVTDVFLRDARPEDQPDIGALIRAAGINPMGLDWPRFIVAEAQARVVGVIQVKQHRDGSRELASLAVAPDYQRRGIGAVLVQTLLAREPGSLYLMCAAPMQSYYPQFGFRVIGPAGMPPYFRRLARLALWVKPVIKTDLVVMHRPAARRLAAAA